VPVLTGIVKYFYGAPNSFSALVSTGISSHFITYIKALQGLSAEMRLEIGIISHVSLVI